MSEDSAENEQRRLVTNQWQILRMSPVEAGLPTRIQPADNVHATVRQSSPKLEVKKRLDHTPGKVAVAGPLMAGGVAAAMLTSPLEMVGDASMWQLFFQTLNLSIPMSLGNAAVGASAGGIVGALMRPHIDLLTPSLATDGKIGTMVGSTDSGELNEVIFATNRLDDVQSDISGAVDRQIRLQSGMTTIAGLMGCEPSRIDSEQIIGAEIRFDVDETYDALAKGTPTTNLLEDGESALPLDKIGATLADYGRPALLQTVCQPRLPQPNRTDRAADAIRRKESNLPALRHLRRARLRTDSFHSSEELSTKDQKRLRKLDQTRAEALFDVNVRAVCLAGTDAEQRQARRTMERVADVLETVTNEYVTTDIEWYTGEGGLLEDNPQTEILRRIDNATVDTTPPYTAGIRANTVRANLVVDADEVWSLLLTPGDGDPRARDARTTVRPSQQQQQQPGNDIRGWFVSNEDDDDSEADNE